VKYSNWKHGLVQFLKKKRQGGQRHGSQNNNDSFPNIVRKSSLPSTYLTKLYELKGDKKKHCLWHLIENKN
jgi:hypothetical protein